MTVIAIPRILTQYIDPGSEQFWEMMFFQRELVPFSQVEVFCSIDGDGYYTNEENILPVQNTWTRQGTLNYDPFQRTRTLTAEFTPEGSAGVIAGTFDIVTIFAPDCEIEL